MGKVNPSTVEPQLMGNNHYNTPTLMTVFHNYDPRPPSTQRQKCTLRGASHCAQPGRPDYRQKTPG